MKRLWIRWRIKRLIREEVAHQRTVVRAQAGILPPDLEEVWIWTKACEALTGDFATAYRELELHADAKAHMLESKPRFYQW